MHQLREAVMRLDLPKVEALLYLTLLARGRHGIMTMDDLRLMLELEDKFFPVQVLIPSPKERRVA